MDNLTQIKNGNIGLGIFMITFALLFPWNTINQKGLSQGEISVKWVDTLTGDFSFKNNWSYPEGVFRNEFGQLSCDGFCPPETDNMKDENGKIYADSLESFYKLIDTTHRFHSIQSETLTHEWAGTNYIIVEKINEDTVVCYTLNNAATHSSLNLIISKNTVSPSIVINYTNAYFTVINNCIGGEMLIDKKLWNQGILKATFDFRFLHEDFYWKGNIYAKIENK